MGIVESEVTWPRTFTSKPMCYFGDGTSANSTARLQACGQRVTGWDAMDAARTGKNCRQLVCIGAPPWFEATHAPIYVTLNGYFDSKELVMPFEYYDNERVFVSTRAPSAGPATGGTLLVVHGSGFVDYGGAVCVINKGALRVSYPATVLGNNTMECTTDGNAVNTLGYNKLLIGVALNGDAQRAQRQPTEDVERSWYFVDMR